MTASQNNWPFIINVGNSIIGVTVLAMPFCFKTCGIILGILLLLFSTWLTIVSCRLLMKAGVSSRRRSYSMLAYFTLGASGKLIVEIGMIGLQLGTLVAQIVIIGDLGPGIVSKAMGIRNSDHLRTGLILVLCLFVGLPLGLLKDVRALSKTSTLCILFYTFFSLYVVLMSIPKLVAGDWYNKVNFWRMEGFFQCLPIFSFAFGCQTQLFITYDALAEPSLKRINAIVGSAVNMCTVSYLLVGFFGYIAFCDVDDLSGDIINHFKENMMSDVLKLCFVFSIAVSIPLIVFPCRMSLYTLCFPNNHRQKDDVPGSWKIPEFHFKVITVVIIVGSMIIGILIPNIEFVLGLNGATTGTLICYIFPALFFLNVMSEKTEGKLSGRLVLACGLTIMIASTYTTLSAQSSVDTTVAGQVQPIIEEKQLLDAKAAIADIKRDDAFVVNKSKFEVIDSVAERHEPPIPQEPYDDKIHDFNNDFEGKKAKEKDIEKPVIELANNKMDSKEEIQNINKDTKKEEENSKINDKVVDVETNGKDYVVKEKEMNALEEKQIEAAKKQNEILEKLEQQQQQQEKIIKEQKEILEQLKEHNDKHKDEESQLDGVDNKLNLPLESNNHLKALPNGQVQMAEVPQGNGQVLGDRLLQDQPDIKKDQLLGGGLLNAPQAIKQQSVLVGEQLEADHNDHPQLDIGQKQGQQDSKQVVGLLNGELQQNKLPLKQDLAQNQNLLLLNQDSKDDVVLNKNHLDSEQVQKVLNVKVQNAKEPEQDIGLDSGLKFNVQNHQADGGELQNNVHAHVENFPDKLVEKKDTHVENVDKVKLRGKRDAEANVAGTNNDVIDGDGNVELKQNAENIPDLSDNIENLVKRIKTGMQVDAVGIVGKERRR